MCDHCNVSATGYDAHWEYAYECKRLIFRRNILEVSALSNAHGNMRSTVAHKGMRNNLCGGTHTECVEEPLVQESTRTQ